MIEFGNLVKAPSSFSALPPVRNARGHTSICFGENQLSPRLISLSPLPTAHPEPFQRLTVRSSMKSYLHFNLAMGRSRGFGSISCNSVALFRLGFPATPALLRLSLAAKNNSRTHYAKGTPSRLRASTACRHTVSGSLSLPSPGFFSPFPHGTGSLSVIEEYLALADGPAGFPPGSSCPVVLGIRAHDA